MPISTSVPINQIDKAAFHPIDELVTALARDIHREFGRMLASNLYEAELAHRIQQSGHTVARDVRVTASIDDYHRDFLIELIVDGSVVVKVKTATRLTGLHRAKLTNSLFLTNANHGTLVNFRTEQVEHDSVTTPLNEAARKNIICTSIDWKLLTPACQLFHDALCRVLCDWGSGLEVEVYRDAVIHFLGGEEKVGGEVEVNADNRPLGRQKMHLLSDDIGFAISASGSPLNQLVEHQRRLLKHTRLQAIQLVNLHRQHVSLHTIFRN